MSMDSGEAPRREAQEACQAIERFLKASSEPFLQEPGEDNLPLRGDNHVIEWQGSRLVLQAWDQKRNLVRRITAVGAERPGRLDVVTEKFGKRPGTLTFFDAGRPANQFVGKRAARLAFRERFRRFLRRRFTDWRLSELTTEQDLEHSLSPSYARAFLKKGQQGMAAIGCSAESNAEGLLTFGLIWLDYLRQRERRLTIEGLLLYLPAGAERNTCLRLRWLNPRSATFQVFVFSEQGVDDCVDLRDYGNTDTRMEPCLSGDALCPPDLAELARLISGIHDVTTLASKNGELSFRIRGLEFARIAGGRLRFGIETKQIGTASNLREIERLVSEVARLRSGQACDRSNPFYSRDPEAWLESQVRTHMEELEPSLLPNPVYGQVPAFAAGNRGVIDMLGVDRQGQLAVLELKAEQDIHLPIQALDYWIRVKWHLDRGEFSGQGYFPGIRLSAEAPRMLLIAPALQFHPATESILQYFSREIEIQRLGLGPDWRGTPQVVFRAFGAQRPG
ncbi:MAG: hypothetical protein KJZ78_07425 [Bryobacteraceae bacterium]|nr:hypothetical protein [Bryobacteraceae bacterium]